MCGIAGLFYPATAKPIDPARLDTDEAFETAFTDIADRIKRLAPALHSPGESDD